VVTEPAVERYKARARALRAEPAGLHDVLPDALHGQLALLAPRDCPSGPTPGAIVSDALRRRPLGYLDVTINGDLPPASLAAIGQRARRLGNEILGVPTKLRAAPAAYHISEQSEMDGPGELVSLRIVARRHQRCIVGSYDDTFLLAQSVATWEAMEACGRCCFLLVLRDGFADDVAPLIGFFDEVGERLRHPARVQGT